MKLFDKISDIAGRLSTKKLILVCALAAIVVFLILYTILSALFAPKAPPAAPVKQTATIVAAARDIPAHTVISSDMLKTVEVAKDAVPAGALVRMDDAVGKAAAVEILSGDALTERKLDEDADNGFTGLIPPGMRALSFSINDITGVAGFAKPGDHVDILIVTDQEGKNRITSHTILKDVVLLAVNRTTMDDVNQSAAPAPVQNAQNQAANAAAQKNGSGTMQQPQSRPQGNASGQAPAVATVALTPYDAAKLSAYLRIGQASLLLRPKEGAESATMPYYVIPLPKGDTPQPAPAPMPAAAPPASGGAAAVVQPSAPAAGGIEVIRGTN